MGEIVLHEKGRRSDFKELNTKELVGFWHRAVGCVVRSVWTIRSLGRYKLFCTLKRELPATPMQTQCCTKARQRQNEQGQLHWY